MQPREPTRRGPTQVSLASPLLLYAEEIDPHTGRHLGNFPQAFSHLALVNAVMHLVREDERIAASAGASSTLDPAPPP
jgi:alpha,alpha-trehalase